jgi:putative DNA primase/helicase
VLATALTLAQKHMAVFPCRPRTKWPATANGLKDATVDLDVIRQWWHANPNYNVAIATGAASRIFVIDIDGLGAEIELRKLEAEYGTLPASVEVITARGRHVYFQQPAQEIRNSASKIAPGIDVRGDGGYVLVPPRRHVDALVATEIVLAVNDARCRPPLERDEVITIIDSIAAREMKRRGIR